MDTLDVIYLGLNELHGIGRCSLRLSMAVDSAFRSLWKSSRICVVSLMWPSSSRRCEKSDMSRGAFMEVSKPMLSPWNVA